MTPLRGPPSISALYIVGFRPPLATQLLAGPAASRPAVRLAELLGDLLGRVVEVAPPVRPADVVHDQHRERRARRAGDLGEHPQLVVHGEPVVVAVDQRDVHRGQRRQHVWLMSRWKM